MAAANCVRVDPPLVAFKDVEVGQVYKIQVTAANVGKTSRNIMMGKPKLKVMGAKRNLVNWQPSCSNLYSNNPQEEPLHLLINTK